MRNKLPMAAVISGLVFAGIVGWQTSMALEADYLLSHDDVFGSLRRPEVSFPHEKHEQSLENGSCALCHHTPDDITGQLAYVEGDERGCKECHAFRKEDSIPALREAFHGNCTSCHRNNIKSKKANSGPTTCGGCHKKPD